MKFKILKATNEQFYFIITARNHQTLLTSETYIKKQSVLKTISALNSKFSTPLPVIDLTKPKH